jgi:hypothetical protein
MALPRAQENHRGGVLFARNSAIPRAVSEPVRTPRRLTPPATPIASALLRSTAIMGERALVQGEARHIPVMIAFHG